MTASPVPYQTFLNSTEILDNSVWAGEYRGPYRNHTPGPWHCEQLQPVVYECIQFNKYWEECPAITGTCVQATGEYRKELKVKLSTSLLLEEVFRDQLVNFDWSYTVSIGVANRSASISSQIGDALFTDIDDTPVANPYYWWTYKTFSHNGATNVPSHGVVNASLTLSLPYDDVRTLGPRAQLHTLSLQFIQPLDTSRSSLKTIIGGSIGGIVVLIGLLLGFWWLVRRRRTGDAGLSANNENVEGLGHVSPLPAKTTAESRTGLLYRKFFGENKEGEQYVDKKAKFPPVSPLADSVSDPSSALPVEPLPETKASAESPADLPPTYDQRHSYLPRHPAEYPDPHPLASRNPQLTHFISENSDIIPISLADKLYTAGYLPADDPSMVSEDYWMDRFGVSAFELARLREAYRRSIARSQHSDGLEKDVKHSSGDIGTSWRPTS